MLGPSSEPAQYLLGPSSEPSQYLLGPSRELAQYVVGPSSEPAQYLLGLSSELAQYVVGPSSEPARYVVGPSSEPAQYVLGLSSEPAQYVLDHLVNRPSMWLAHLLNQRKEAKTIRNISLTTVRTGKLYNRYRFICNRKIHLLSETGLFTLQNFANFCIAFGRKKCKNVRLFRVILLLSVSRKMQNFCEIENAKIMI